MKTLSSKRLKQIGGAVALLIFLILFYYGFRDVNRIRAIIQSVDTLNLIGSAILYATGLLLSVWVLHRLYLIFGVSVPFWRAYYIAFLSLLGRYIPGKLWILGFASYISKSIGKDPVRVLWASIVNQMISIFSIIPFVFILYLKTGNQFLMIGGIMVVIGAVSGSWWIYRKNKIPFIGIMFPTLTAVYFMSWLLTGVAFYMFLTGMGISGDFLSLISIFPVSYLVGLLSFFAPGGIGIRELSLSYFLSGYMDMETSVAVGVMFRIFTTVIELLMSVIAYIMYIMDKPEDGT